jgi:hypothetical protein
VRGVFDIRAFRTLKRSVQTYRIASDHRTKQVPSVRQSQTNPPYAGAVFYPEMIAAMAAALEQAWIALTPEEQASTDRTVLAQRILSLTAQGETDPDVLCARALIAVVELPSNQPFGVLHMPPSVRMIVEMNIHHYRELLKTETDPIKRKTIARLLAEEEEKFVAQVELGSRRSAKQKGCDPHPHNLSPV